MQSGLNVTFITAFGRVNTITSVGDIGNITFSSDGGISATNITAGFVPGGTIVIHAGDGVSKQNANMASVD